MKSPLLLFPLGLLVAALTFLLASRLATHSHRALRDGPDAELAWLRHEFRLSDAQFDRITQLHHAYRPTCAELCRRIAEQNERLAAAASAARALNPELRRLVAETGRVRDDCREAMLAHLYAVAGEMPPDEGRRYLEMMLRSTCVLEEARPIDAIHRHGADE